jgi:hypothetical protein
MELITPEDEISRSASSEAFVVARVISQLGLRAGLSGRVVLNGTASETRELVRLEVRDQAVWSTLSRAVTPTRERLEERLAAPGERP